jgi:predicted amidohydrolase YtcJ
MSKLNCWRVLLTAVVLAGCAGPPEPADLLLVNGKILTIDDDFSVVSAMAVRDGRIVAVGGESLGGRFAAREIVNLEGQTVMPGFIDSHTHVRGQPRRYIELTEVESIEQLLDLVTAKAAELGPGEWITGYGWSEDELAEQRRPLRADLDEAAPDNPVILTRAGGHSAVCNSAALDLAEIDRSTPDPPGGVIEKGPDGRLNGVIRETQDMVGKLVPESTFEEKRPDLIRRLKDQFRHGITSLTNASASIEEFEEWERVYAGHGDELPRAAVQILWPGSEKIEAFGKKFGDGDERLRVGPIKLFVDGGFTGPAAYTIEPYKGQPEYRGKLNLTEQELHEAIFAANKKGWQLGIHAIGDAAIELTVNELVAALEESPKPDHRHYLNHFTIKPPDETMRQMAEHGIAITQQPNFTYTLEGRYAEHLDGERLETNNPLRSPMDAGIFVAISSDVLPIGPPVGLYAAVTRKGMSGRVFGPSEAITIEEALTAYTRNGAWLSFEEDSKGSLEPGKWADFIVLEQDPLTMPIEDLLDLKVNRTYLAGERVF